MMVCGLSIFIRLTLKMPDVNFTIVSKNVDTYKFGPNVTVHNGSWRSEELDDSFIRKLYHNSSLTILPIKETFQPSGQSVSLQSMSCGTPVMITKTKGFWDNENFIDGKKLAKAIKENHLYLTASINEPSGNHHIESSQCGLPLLFINSGGIPEYAELFGVKFASLFKYILFLF